MAAKNQITIGITAQTSGLNRGLKNARGQLTGFQKTTRTASIGLASLVKGFALLGIASKATQFIGGSITEARDLNETLNKSAVIFGKSAGEISKWGNTAAASFGLSKNEAISAAASFGDMFLQLGANEKQATALSKSQVQLAADLGSFSNLDTADVLERLSAAYRGEYDSLQKVIPNISAARVEHEALRMTGKKSAKQLTALDKAMAVNAIVSKDGARAHGDFARTSNSLANRQKILSAKTKDLQAKLGKLLLPAVTALVGWGIKLTDALSRMGPTFDKVKKAVSGFFDRFSGGSGEAQSKFTQLKSTVASVWQSIKSIFSSAVTIITTLWNAFGSTLVSYVTTSFTNLMNAIRGYFTVIKGIFNVFAGLLKGDWSRVWTGIKQIVSGAWTVIKAVVAQGWNVVKTLFKVAVIVLKGVVKGLWSALKSAFSAGWSAVKSLTSKAWNSIKSAAKSGISKVVSEVKSLPGKAKSALSGAAAKLYDVGARMIQGLINGIKSAAKAVVNAAKGVVKNAIDGAKSLLHIKSPSRVFQNIGLMTMKGLIIGLEGENKALSKTVNGIVGTVTSASDRMVLTAGVETRNLAHASLITGSGSGANRTYEITVVAPVGASSADIGRELTRHIREFEKAGGR